MKKSLVKILYAAQAFLDKSDRSCPFCGSDSFEIVFRKKGMVDICRCGKCGLYWTNPIFRLNRLYDTIYDTGDMTTEMNEKKLRGLLRTDFTGSWKDFHGVLEWLAKIAPGRKLLDFGSSWGYFLYQAKQYGFEVTGFDVSEKMAQFGNVRLGIPIVTDIQELLEKNMKFDVIFSSHTFEHLGKDIQRVFGKLRALLKDEGVLVIEIPRLRVERGAAAFASMGAVHPLGFTEEFFEKGVPAKGFSVEVYRDYSSLMPKVERGKDGGILVAVCRKK